MVHCDLFGANEDVLRTSQPGLLWSPIAILCGPNYVKHPSNDPHTLLKMLLKYSVIVYN